MKVLGISASPRRNGNSEILLDEVLKGASSAGARVEKIILNELKIRPCQSCARCTKEGACHIRDDAPRIYRKIEEANAVAIASPVYFGSITAQLKTFIDRCHLVWIKNLMLKRRAVRRKRPGIFISVSSYNRVDFFKNSRQIINIFFKVLGFETFKELYAPNLEHRGEVLKDKVLLEKAFRYGAALVKRLEPVRRNI